MNWEQGPDQAEQERKKRLGISLKALVNEIESEIDHPSEQGCKFLGRGSVSW